MCCIRAHNETALKAVNTCILTARLTRLLKPLSSNCAMYTDLSTFTVEPVVFSPYTQMTVGQQFFKVGRAKESGCVLGLQNIDSVPREDNAHVIEWIDSTPELLLIDKRG